MAWDYGRDPVCWPSLTNISNKAWFFFVLRPMLLRTKPFICWLAVEFQLTNLITDKKNECRIFQLVVHFTQFSHFNETKPLEIGTTKEKALAKYSVFKEKLLYKSESERAGNFSKFSVTGLTLKQPKSSFRSPIPHRFHDRCLQGYIDGRHSYKLGLKP